MEIWQKHKKTSQECQKVSPSQQVTKRLQWTDLTEGKIKHKKDKKGPQKKHHLRNGQ